ncbi:MAG: lysostaphin resistance A-like protein [Haloglomus sp.]
MDDLTGLSGASPAERLRSVGAGIGLTVAGFVTSLVVVFIGVRALVAAGVPVQDRPVLGIGLAIVLQGIGFGVAVALYMAATREFDLLQYRLPTLRDLGWAVGGLIAVFVGYVVIAVVISQLGVDTAENAIVEQGRKNPQLVLYLIPLAIIVVGPSEELLFRGAIQGVLRRAYAPIPAILIASALFGVAHVFALSGSGTGVLAYIGVTFALGCILGFVYERTENLVVPALIHGAYNAILFSLLYVQVSGGP